MPYRTRPKGEYSFFPDRKGNNVDFASNMAAIEGVDRQTRRLEARFHNNKCGCARCQVTLDEIDDNADRGEWLVDKNRMNP